MGISYIKRVSEEGMLGLWHITETWEYLGDQLGLSGTDQLILSEKKTDARKREWLACRVLLQNMLDARAEIAYHENGKPYITTESHFISMSHSGAYACVYLDKNRSTGIDIQQLKPSISKGSDFFLNEAEQEWADIENNTLLHIIWSVKESVFKFAGDPSIDIKKHIITTSFNSNQNDSIEVKLISRGSIETVKVNYETFDDYVLTWTI